jgi:hypothetical protein
MGIRRGASIHSVHIRPIFWELQDMNRNQPRSFLRLFSTCGVFLLSMALLTTLAEAQTRPGGPPDGPGIEQVATKLQLSAEQQGAFVEIMGDFRTSMEALMEKYGVDPTEGRPPLRVMMAMRAGMQKNVAQMEKQLQTVLSAEQMDNFKQLQQQQRKARGDGR